MEALTTTQELRIRKFESQDLTAISEIEQLSFKDPFPSYFLSQLAEANPDTFLVAVRSGIIVGYAVIDRWPDQ
jgi:ribosomal protein S18 acetylase RimI-like enzyme